MTTSVNSNPLAPKSVNVSPPASTRTDTPQPDERSPVKPSEAPRDNQPKEVRPSADEIRFRENVVAVNRPEEVQPPEPEENTAPVEKSESVQRKEEMDRAAEHKPERRLQGYAEAERNATGTNVNLRV